MDRVISRGSWCLFSLCIYIILLYIYIHTRSLLYVTGVNCHGLHTYGDGLQPHVPLHWFQQGLDDHSPYKDFRPWQIWSLLNTPCGSCRTLTRCIINVSLQHWVRSHVNRFQRWSHNSSGFILVGEIVTTRGCRLCGSWKFRIPHRLQENWIGWILNLPKHSASKHQWSIKGPKAWAFCRLARHVSVRRVIFVRWLASSLLNYDAAYDCTQHRQRISPSLISMPTSGLLLKDKGREWKTQLSDFGKVEVIWHVFKGLLWASSLHACRIPPMPRSHPLNLLVFEGTERVSVD